MTNQQIIESIRGWREIKDNSDEIIRYFEQGNAFSYSLPSGTSPTEDIHVYPGIYDKKLFFLTLLAKYDKPEYLATIANHVTVSPMEWSIMDTRIPESEAKERVARWNNDYRGWIQSQVTTADGIFMAFNVKAEDFEVPNAKVNMALRRDSMNPFARSIADLIILNDDYGILNYDDYVTPVPPYNASALQSSFYLMSV